MRFRVFYLIVLASLLGTPVLVHRANAAQRCASIADPAMCAAALPDPAWVRPAGLLSLLALVTAGVLYARAYAARQQEKQMLDAVGVHVPEQDLPLEE